MPETDWIPPYSFEVEVLVHWISIKAICLIPYYYHKVGVWKLINDVLYTYVPDMQKAHNVPISGKFSIQTWASQDSHIAIMYAIVLSIWL